jgi:hypothetical protein
MAMNDGAVGPDGRFYAGSLNGKVLKPRMGGCGGWATGPTRASKRGCASQRDFAPTAAVRHRDGCARLQPSISIPTQAPSPPAGAPEIPAEEGYLTASS